MLNNFFKHKADKILPPNEFWLRGEALKAVVEGRTCWLNHREGNVTQKDAKMVVSDDFSVVCESLVPGRENLWKNFMEKTASNAVWWAKEFNISPDNMWQEYFTEQKRAANQREARRKARKGDRN